MLRARASAGRCAPCERPAWQQVLAGPVPRKMGLADRSVFVFAASKPRF